MSASKHTFSPVLLRPIPGELTENTDELRQKSYECWGRRNKKGTHLTAHPFFIFQ